MYNARNYFKSAQARPLNANGRPNPQAVADYTKTIEKCGIILTDKKDGAEADDALFLMARALYYKGNSAFQAKDQFDNLIRLFPDSPFVPEAYIYQAKVLREINKAAEAEKLLEEFIRNPIHQKYHPQALLVLSDFEIIDKDYYRAQYWLEKLLNDYPKADEYDGALLLYAKNYYVQKDYLMSIKQLHLLLDRRGVSKDTRFEANYYLALNYYRTNQLEMGYKLIRTLVNSEYRTDKIAANRVLKARFLLAMGEAKEALSEFDYITKTYPRSGASAEANYLLGDHNFYTLGDLPAAIGSYNRVRSEFATSEYVALAQEKANASSQINQGKNLNSETNLQQFLDYHYLAADHYYRSFALSDSTLALYQRIFAEGMRLSVFADSLNLRKENLSALTDSLQLRLSSLALSDSIMASDDSLVAVVDSMKQSIEPEKDSDSEEMPNPKANLESEIQTLHSEARQVGTRSDNLKRLLQRYQDEVIPFTNFVKASFLKDKLNNSSAVDSIFTYMQEQYPNSKYTTAIGQLRENQPIRLIDKREHEAEAKYDLALGYATDNPDSMRVILNELHQSELSGIALRAKFRLGWFYSFEEIDTTAAKPFLDEVLKASDAVDYVALVRRFYNGSKFLYRDDLSALSDSLKPSADSLLSHDEKQLWEDNSDLQETPDEKPEEATKTEQVIEPKDIDKPKDNSLDPQTIQR